MPFFHPDNRYARKLVVLCKVGSKDKMIVIVEWVWSIRSSDEKNKRDLKIFCEYFVWRVGVFCGRRLA